MERGNGWRIRAGKAPSSTAGGYGSDSVVVDVDVHWQGDNGRGARGFQTVEHAYVPDVLEVTFTYDRRTYRGTDVGGGAGVPDAIGEVLAYGGAERDPAPELLELAELAERWHLSALRAGCAHQSVVWEPGPYGRRQPSLELTPACPVSGYRYGHSWLVEPVPADVLERVAAIGERYGVRLGDPWRALSRCGYCGAELRAVPDGYRAPELAGGLEHVCYAIDGEWVGHRPALELEAIGGAR